MRFLRAGMNQSRQEAGPTATEGALDWVGEGRWLVAGSYYLEAVGLISYYLEGGEIRSGEIS